MNDLSLGLRENRTSFEPGELLQGAARWELKAAPKLAEIRLVWFTRGKGTEDIEPMDTVAFDVPLAGDVRDFQITLPRAPYSFSGRLISLIWAVELVLEPGSLFTRIEITLAPGGAEVVLPQLPGKT